MIENLRKDDIVEKRLNSMFKPIHPDIEILFEKFGSNEAAFYHFAKNYVYFNNRFASGVISLASNIHASLAFDDHNEKGSIIAANIYAACDHEYHEHINGKDYTHAQLSKFFLSNLDRCIFGMNSYARPNAFGISDEIKAIANKVSTLYQMYMTKSEIETKDYKRLAQGLGFHMASEHMASSEYYTITRLAQFQFTSLYNKMQKPTDDVRFDKIEPWHWVGIHSTVEIEHFAAGLQSYRDSDGLFKKEDVLEGIELFTTLSTEFMTTTMNEINEIKKIAIIKYV